MKQVILMRTDLGMSAGKIAAQAAHAAGGYSTPRIVLAVTGIDELNLCHSKAMKAGLLTKTITDAGHTEVPPGTFTCCSIGPAEDAIIDKITGHLALL